MGKKRYPGVPVEEYGSDEKQRLFEVIRLQNQFLRELASALSRRGGNSNVLKELDAIEHYLNRLESSPWTVEEIKEDLEIIIMYREQKVIRELRAGLERVRRYSTSVDSLEGVRRYSTSVERDPPCIVCGKWGYWEGRICPSCRAKFPEIKP